MQILNPKQEHNYDGRIPVDWRVVRVKEIIRKLKRGPSLNTNDIGRGVIYVTSDFITDEGILQFKNLKFLDLDLVDDISKYLLDPNDVILNCVNSFEKVGKAAIFEGYSQKVIVGFNNFALTFNSSVNPFFIKYLFLSHNMRNVFKSISKPAIHQVSFSSKDLFKVKVHLPRIAEQEKIASILSKVDELIQKTDQIIEQTQRLKKGLMQKLLTKGINHKSFYQTDIGEIPVEWRVSTIGSKCKVGTGGTPSRRKPEYFEGNIPWVKTTEINYNVITSTEEHITENALKESSAKYYDKGTLLMAMYGEGVTRGRCAMLGIGAAINQACAAIQSIDDISNEFIFYWCQWRYDYLRSKSHGTHQSNFNMEFVKAIEISLPPLKEQGKIVDFLTKIDDTLNVQKNYKKKALLLKKGLMQNLLTGKIRVKV